MTLQQIQELITEIQKIDDVCGFPNKEQIQRCVEAKDSLPKYEGELDVNQYRYYTDYLTQTIFIGSI